MIPELPAAFLGNPIAHRALHDISDKRPENSRAAIRAAIASGYGIEIDLQLTSDGQAMVFHDYSLERLTTGRGPIRQLTAAQAAQLPLLHGDGETVPTLPEVLELVDRRVPLLIELKDQDGGIGPAIGALEAATAAALKQYAGPVAVMSFNPHSVARMADLAPELPRGLVTGGFVPENWPLPVATCDRLREIPDFDSSGAAFISHNVRFLDTPPVKRLHDRGVPVLCWTVESAQTEAEARLIADNITFEGYLAALVT